MSYGWVSPEISKLGLVFVDRVDWLHDTGCYEWSDTTVMFHPESEMFYWETSSGCSCNGPLEDVRSLEDLESGRFWALTQDLEATLVQESASEYRDAELLKNEVVRVIEAAQKVWWDNR